MYLSGGWLIRSLQICNQNSTISLDCSEEEMRRRLERRAESSDRIDDNPDTVLMRFQTFKENNAPVIAHLQKRGPVYHVSELMDVHLNPTLIQAQG